jgi:hypothetical protein
MLLMATFNIDIDADSKSLGHPYPRTLAKRYISDISIGLNIFSLGLRVWIRTIGTFFTQATLDSRINNHHRLIMCDMFLNWNQIYRQRFSLRKEVKKKEKEKEKEKKTASAY